MSYRSNFVIYLGHTPLFLGQGAPSKVMAPANPSWRSPHCCQQETKMAHLVRAIAQCSHYPSGGGAGRINFRILAEVHLFNEATNFLDLIFLKDIGTI